MGGYLKKCGCIYVLYAKFDSYLFSKRPNIDRFFPRIIFISDIVIEDVIHGCLGYPVGRFCKQFCL